jgi:signal transduction histidine kinase
MKIITKLIFPVLYIFISLDLSGQSSYGFKDISTVHNLDSMEGAIPHLKKNTLDYIKHLITIEQNRIKFVSYKTGKYINEIDSLSKIESFEFGTAFVQYYKCVSVSKSPNKLKEILIHGEPALKTFGKLNDSMGIFLLNINTIKISSGVLLYKAITGENNFESVYKSKKDIQTLYKDMTRSLIASTAAFVSRHKDPYYHIIWNNIKSNILFENIQNNSNPSLAVDSIRLYATENLSIIKKHPEYSYLLYSTYVYYGNSYFFTDNPQSGMEYHLLAQNLPMHRESINIILSHLNLAHDYDQLYKNKKLDSVSKYAQLALAILDRKDFNNNTKGYLMKECYSILSHVYELKGDLNTSNLYLKKASEIQNITENEMLSQSISTYFEFDIYREQAIKTKEIEIENKTANQRIIFGLIFIAFLTMAIFILYRTNIKLQRAKEEIELLNKTREKFYAIVSHDLRSPIESYQGLASTIGFLINQGKYDDISQIADQIDKTGLKLKDLISNLLNWSLEQQNLIGIQSNPINVYELLELLIPIYRPLVLKKNLSIDLNIDTKIIVLSDKNILSTIIRNIIDNAIKNALPDSVIHIHMKTENNRQELIFSNKSKLRDEQFKTINELFLVKNNWQPGHEGLGLGLILIKEFSSKIGIKTRVTHINGVFSFILTY